MPFKKVASLDADTTVALGKKDKQTGKSFPKSAEGYYLGTRTVETKKGPAKLHFLQTPKGNLGLWGTTDMNRKISQVKPGTMIRVTSTGMKPTPKGDMYTYDVEIDEENHIEVEFSAASEETGASVTTDEEEVDGEEEELPESAEDLTPEQQDALLAAEAEKEAKKAKVEAILKRGKGSKTA